MSREEKVKEIHNLIILDESGSMMGIKSAVIDGFHNLSQDLKKSARLHAGQMNLASLTTFNGNRLKNLLVCQPIAELVSINEHNYRPDNSTPLCDAICTSVLKLKKELAGNGSYRVLVTIITDGEENSSSRFTQNDTSTLISELSEDSRWGFGLIGANFDVYEIAERFHISTSRIIQFQPEKSDVERMFTRYSKAQANMSACFYRGGNFLDDDIPF